MRVGLVIYGSLDTLSGGYLYDRRLVEYLHSQGDQVETISLPWRNYAAHLSDNLSFRLPGVGTSNSSSATQQPTPLQNFDILIQDELNHPSLVLANRRARPYPVVSLVHHLRCSERRPGWQNALYRFLERQYLLSVDGFIFNSRTTEKEVHRLLDHHRPGIVAHPPADRFGEPVSDGEILNRAKANPLRVLFLGNVIYRKGLHTLLEAISLLRSGIRVDVVGSLSSEPEYAGRIRKYIEEKHLSSSVFLHGALYGHPLVEKLRQAHLMVVPSSYEGFGIVYLEGMCFGLPAIGTTAGAAGEIIQHDRTGYLIAREDSNSLAAHLASLAENRSQLARLSLNARERYFRQPSWEATAGRIREFLEIMIARSG